MYTIQGTFTEEDYLNANKLHRRYSKTWRWLYIALILELCLLLFLAFYTQRWTPVIIGVILALLLIGLYMVYLPYRLRKIFKQQKELHRPYTITIDEAGTHFKNEMGEANRPWNIFLKWKEDDNIIILYHSDLLFSMLPKRYLNDESIQFIRGQLEKNNVSKK